MRPAVFRPEMASTVDEDGNVTKYPTGNGWFMCPDGYRYPQMDEPALPEAEVRAVGTAHCWDVHGIVWP